MDAYDIEWKCGCGHTNPDYEEGCRGCGERRYPEEEERDDFPKWADALESFVSNTGGKIVCYDEDFKTPALDCTEFVLNLIAAHRVNRSLV